MFLFIGCSSNFSISFSTFKYISCFYLSAGTSVLLACLMYSNTSHVFIYRFLKWSDRVPIRDSNTSHVFIYLYLYSLILRWVKDSNTSHVFIYRLGGKLMIEWFSFKYISCFYLSNIFITIFSSIV